MASLLGKSFKIQSTASDTSGVQFRVGYDGSNKADFSVSSGGDLTIAPSGGDTALTGDLDISGTLDVTGATTLDSTLTVASNVQAGQIVGGTSTATPVYITAGSTFASTAGDAAKTKMRVFEDNTGAIFGFGVSSALLETHAPASSEMAWYINNTERMRIDSSGNLGLGVSSPTHNLHLKTSSSTYLRLEGDFGTGYVGMETSDDSMRIVTAQSTPIQFYTDNNERVRIDSSGNVGINDSSPTYKLDVNGTTRVTGATTLDSTLTVSGDANFDSGTLFVDVSEDALGIGTTAPATNNLRLQQKLAIVSSGSNVYSGASLNTYSSNGSAASVLDFNKSKATAEGSMTAVGNGDVLGYLVFRGSNGTDFADGTYLRGVADGAVAASMVPARMEFYTTNSAGTTSETMRLTSAGNVQITSGNLVLSNGAGIDFSATPNGSGTTASELLDDYEEGTWTPVIKIGATTQSIGGVTYAYYVKIGKVVYYSCTMTSITKSGSGNLTIEGLPFTIGAANPYSDTTGTMRWDGIATGGVTYAYPNVSTTTISPQKYNTSGFIGLVAAADISATYNLYSITGFYYV